MTESLRHFFAMGGYAGYVWSCYVLTVIVLAGNLWFARRDLLQQKQRATRRATTPVVAPIDGAADAS